MNYNGSRALTAWRIGGHPGKEHDMTWAVLMSASGFDVLMPSPHGRSKDKSERIST